MRSKAIAGVLLSGVLASCTHSPNGLLLPNQAVRLAPASIATKDSSLGYKTIFSFDGADGSGPNGPLIDAKAELYGTTGGGGNWSTGGGTVFEVTTGGTERVLHNFGQPPDGRSPQGDLVDLNGTFYGTTSQGGKYKQGTVFSVDGSGDEKVLHSFGNGNDGIQPAAGLVALNGTLYGTTSSGGTHNSGTVFSIKTTGSEHVLHDFDDRASQGGYDPIAALTTLNGVLYGTTSRSDCYGTAFSITTSGKFHVLHDFACRYQSDGSYPDTKLLATNGTLYGTTPSGQATYGSQYYGTVYSVTTAGKEKVLHYFSQTVEGIEPEGSLVAANGRLYGTTYEGGANYKGTIFSVTFSGTEKVIYSFKPPPDGWAPYAGLVDVSGVLYGTAAGGGKNLYGGGTVFKISP